MKKSLILFIVVCAVVAGAIVYLKKQKTPAPPAPVAETAPAQPEPQPEQIASTPKPQPAPPATTPVPAPVAVAATPTPAEPVVAEPTNSIRKIVDGLLTARAEKHAMFLQL